MATTPAPDDTALNELTLPFTAEEEKAWGKKKTANAAAVQLLGILLDGFDKYAQNPQGSEFSKFDLAGNWETGFAKKYGGELKNFLKKGKPVPVTIDQNVALSILLKVARQSFQFVSASIAKAKASGLDSESDIDLVLKAYDRRVTDLSVLLTAYLAGRLTDDDGNPKPGIGIDLEKMLPLILPPAGIALPGSRNAASPGVDASVSGAPSLGAAPTDDGLLDPSAFGAADEDEATQGAPGAPVDAQTEALNQLLAKIFDDLFNQTANFVRNQKTREEALEAVASTPEFSNLMNLVQQNPEKMGGKFAGLRAVLNAWLDFADKVHKGNNKSAPPMDDAGIESLRRYLDSAVTRPQGLLDATRGLLLEQPNAERAVGAALASHIELLQYDKTSHNFLSEADFFSDERPGKGGTKVKPTTHDKAMEVGRAVYIYLFDESKLEAARGNGAFLDHYADPAALLKDDEFMAYLRKMLGRDDIPAEALADVIGQLADGIKDGWPSKPELREKFAKAFADASEGPAAELAVNVAPKPPKSAPAPGLAAAPDAAPANDDAKPAPVQQPAAAGAARATPGMPTLEEALADPALAAALQNGGADLSLGSTTLGDDLGLRGGVTSDGDGIVLGASGATGALDNTRTLASNDRVDPFPIDARQLEAAVESPRLSLPVKSPVEKAIAILSHFKANRQDFVAADLREEFDAAGNSLTDTIKVIMQIHIGTLGDSPQLEGHDLTIAMILKEDAKTLSRLAQDPNTKDKLYWHDLFDHIAKNNALSNFEYAITPPAPADLPKPPTDSRQAPV
ncbi:MAG: hypothetical protein AB7G06_07010, partial [Bdellovibrionales bacterium]